MLNAHEPLTTRMSSKGQIVIPRKACDALGVHAGTEFTIRVEEDGYKLIPKKKGLDAFLALSRQPETSATKPKVSREDAIGEYLMEKDAHARRQARKDFQSRKKKQ